MDSPVEQRVEARCPACRETGILLTTVPVDIPWFGEALETVVRCPSCGFRHADFMITGQREPARWTIAVTPASLEGRVVRASSGTWRVPELGFLAEPTPQSEAFVTNVEGMLDRVRDILLRARQMYRVEEPEKAAVAEQLLERLARVLAGDEPATLIVEDPFGNSAISHPTATREALTEEEVATLATGHIMLDADEVGL